MSLIDKLNWRFATKKYDATKEVPQEKIDRILRAIRCARTPFLAQKFLGVRRHCRPRRWIRFHCL